MSFGIQVFNPNGALSIDGTGFTFIGAITVPAGSGGGSKYYPEFTGVQAYITQIPNSLSPTGYSIPSISYVNNYPVISWGSTTIGYVIYVFGH